MKSLDNLIQHLLEEIALCGDYGADTHDFIKYVNAYHAQVEDSVNEPQRDSTKGKAVDRRFLEKVWGWLTRSPEIEVGENGLANKLPLSEVERRNTLTGTQSDEIPDQVPSTPEPRQNQGNALPPPKVNKKSGHTSSKTLSGNPLGKPEAKLRIYAKVERRWQAIAGHAPDPIKIPRLDFACLSIIAAHRENGISQPHLIRISGQDKRSVPERTRRLCEGGYISKTPVLINGSHTSKLILKRFIKDPTQDSNAAKTIDDVSNVLRSSKNSTENEIDFFALQHNIFNILREVKLITFKELQGKLGITGLPWPMRLFATYLRRLEHIGCIKQVRAHPDTDSTAPFLFRCVKYIRDPEGKEWEPLQFPSKRHPKESNVEINEPEAFSDHDNEYEAQEAQYLARHGANQPLQGLKEVERAIPQWSGDSTLSNLLYDLINSSGLQGISTMGLKDWSLGRFNGRPTENHLSRLVEMWQMSQPLHLRHLSIIRDAALTDGIPHYVYYTFENFKKLVDDGKASWESVMTITKEHKDFKATAAVEAKPDLDENGFPRLASNLFQGRHNHASLAQCIEGADAPFLSLSGADPRAVKLRDGSWGLRSKSLAHPLESPKLPKGSSRNLEPMETPRNRTKRSRNIGKEPNLVVTSAGRERKVPKKGLPPGFSSLSSKEQRTVLWCQEAAKKYQKSKITKEVEKRVHEGGDRYETTAAVLNLAMVQYQRLAQEPPWEIMEEIRVAALMPSLMALEWLKHHPNLNAATRNHEDVFQVGDLRPSAVAHSRSLHEFESQVATDILSSRIHRLQSIPIDDRFKNTDADLTLEAKRSHNGSQVISPYGVVRGQLPSRRGGNPKKKVKFAAAKIPDSTIATSPDKAMSGKKKNNRRKSAAPHSIPSEEHSGNVSQGHKGIFDQYTPSVAAHTFPIPKNTEAAGEAPVLKRKPEPVEKMQNKRQKRASWKRTQLDERADVGKVPDPPRPMQRNVTQSYKQQLEEISRTNTGCHMGNIVKLSRPGKGGAKCKSQLAVFKSARIRELACFLDHALMTEVVPQTLNRHQTVENEGDQPNGDTNAGGNAKPSPLAASPVEDSLTLVPQQSMTPPVSSPGKDCFQRPQVGRALDQGDLSPPFFGNFVSEPLDPENSATHPLLCTPPVVEHNAGTKRRLTVDNEARRESSPAPPISVTNDITAAKSSHNDLLISKGEVSFPEDQPPPPIDNVQMPPVQQEPRFSPLPSDPSSSTERYLMTEEPSECLPMPNHQSVRPVSSTDGINRSNPGAHIDVSHTMDAGSNQSISENYDGSNQETAQEQERPHDQDVARQTSGLMPTSLLADANQNGLVDHVVLDNLRIRDGSGPCIPSEESPRTETVWVPDGMAKAHRSAVSPLVLQSGSDGVANSHEGNEASTLQDADITDAAVAEPEVPQVTLDSSSKLKRGSGVKKMKPQGGSIAAQRREIVMEIVERCGGIYPGISELGVPFKEQWTRSGYPGKSEAATLKLVVKSLCESGKLRQLTFCFKDRRGLIVKRSMVTKVEVSPTDPRVSDMQKMIIKMHPAWYIPDATGRLEEVRDTYWNPKGRMKNRTVKDLEVEEEKVQLQQKPEYLERYEVKEKSKQERKVQEERQASIIRALVAQGKLPDRSILGSLKTRYSRNRLLSLAKRTVQGGSHNRAGPLASIQKPRAGPGGDDTKGKPRPTGEKSSRKRSQATIRDEAAKRLEELQGSGVPQTRGQLTFAHMLTTEDFERDFRSQMLEEKLHELAIERITAANVAEGIAFDARRPSVQRSDELPSFSNHYMHDERIGPSEASQTMTFRLSSNGLSFVSEADVDLLRPAKHRRNLDPSSHSWAARQQMYTIMEPEHIFHPTTGTFSVNFSPFRTARQIMGKYHWQRPLAKGFHDLVDDSKRFELTVDGLEDAKFKDWPFVNYTFPHNHTVCMDQSDCRQGSTHLRFDDVRGQQQFFRKASGHRRAKFPELSEDFRTAREERVALVPAKRKRRTRSELYKTRRLSTLDKSMRSSKPRSRGDASNQPGFDAESFRDSTRRRAPTLTSDVVRRLLTAVTVIRTLTGGVDRNIDWVLVTKAFEPEWHQLEVQRTWPKVLQAHRVQAEMIQSEFQILFLKAYEKGLVPALNYDNLQEYDWPWLVDWTVEHLDTPIDTALDLPSQRDKLEESFDISAGEVDIGMSAYFELDGGACSVERRQHELHKRAWVQSLIAKPLQAPDVDADDLAIAKTWIRANIATKSERYRPEFARDKIDKRFSAGTIDQAIKELLGERVIMQLNKGRLQPKRNYGLNQQYIKRLVKKLEVAHFQRAAMFKREIDRALAGDRKMLVPQTVEDAFAIAIQNMQAHRRISLTAENPPMEKFGVGGFGNYRSRQIPFEKYDFDVGIQATDAYVEGNPLLPLPNPLTTSQSEAEREKIPLWCDINGDVMEDLWMIAVAAVMAILVIRPGVSIHEIEALLGPTLELWEIQVLLEWMVEAKAAKRVGERYMTEEWWWLCLDRGRTFEEDRLAREKVSEGRGIEEGRGSTEEPREDEGDVPMEDV